MSAVVLALIIAGITVVALAGAFVFAERAVNATTPQGIVPRLKRTGRPQDVRLRGSGQTWNPAKPWGPRNWLYGPGRGTYWLDDDGQVHLDWARDGRDTEHLVGPVPAVADPTNPSRRRARRATRT